MVIGIIGAGISGLVAGRKLAKKGHDVTVLEKSSEIGGRMATRYAGKGDAIKLDHGLSYFLTESPEFQSLAVELLDKGIIQRWGDNFALYDGEKIYDTNPNQPNAAAFTAKDGMNSIGKYLSRWVDIKTDTLAGGLTYIGSNRSKKRSWMINLTAGNTFEADAVVIATAAPQAYGLLNTTIDETNTLKIVRDIDDVHYAPCYTLLVGYGDRKIPDWDGIICKNSNLQFISNEASKKTNSQECYFVVQATPEFTKKLRGKSNDVTREKMLQELAEIIGGWATTPEWSQNHLWKYSRPLKTLPKDYYELEFDDAPLALVGDYFNGNTIDSAYRSGFRLATDWSKKYSH